MNKYKTEIKWSVIFSLMTLGWMLLEKLSGLHGKYIDYQMYLTNLFAMPAIWIYVLALKDKKKNFYNGNINYKQGLIFGIVISVLIAVLSPAIQWIISFVISPEYFPNVIKRSVELGYYKTIEEAREYFNYKNYAVQSTIAAFVMGVITSAIVAFFLRTKQKKETE